MGTKFRDQSKPELFLPSGALEFVAIDILGLISRARSDKQYVVIITSRYSSLTRVMPTAKIMSTQVARTFLTNLAIPYCNHDSPLFDIGQQFLSKICTFICKYLGGGKLRTTAYHYQANGKFARNNLTLVP